jgi:hypothetical protein
MTLRNPCSPCAHKESIVSRCTSTNFLLILGLVRRVVYTCGNCAYAFGAEYSIGECVATEQPCYVHGILKMHESVKPRALSPSTKRAMYPNAWQ